MLQLGGMPNIPKKIADGANQYGSFEKIEKIVSGHMI